MQREIMEEHEGMPIHILGVNAPGAEQGNDGMMAGRMLPWLQDGMDADFAGMMKAQHFDLVVVDASGATETVINLRNNDLGIPENYAAVKAMLLNMAGHPG